MCIRDSANTNLYLLNEIIDWFNQYLYQKLKKMLENRNGFNENANHSFPYIFARNYRTIPTISMRIMILTGIFC